MITDADITKLKTIFATKDDLKLYATKDDLKEYANKKDIIEFKDAILKEIRDMRDEIALVIGYKDQIEDHEDRIEVLEKSAVASRVS